MADWPTSPAPGQLYSFAGRTWSWTGQAWALLTTATAGGGAHLFRAGVVPVAVPFAQFSFVRV
jgi:hypothetical protein